MTGIIYDKARTQTRGVKVFLANFIQIYFISFCVSTCNNAHRYSCQRAIMNFFDNLEVRLFT